MSASTFVIAEAGVNHNGQPDLAVRLVDAAAAAGADAVKFQTFRADALIGPSAAKAAYQQTATGTGESQLDMVRKLELGRDAHRQIAQHCRQRNIQFLSTPFDHDSADFLVRTLAVPTLKIPSGEITNGPFLLHLARLGVPLILSTGMSTLGEVEAALGVLAFGLLGDDAAPGADAFRAAFADARGQAALAAKVSLLHCTTEYPAPFADVNLRAMDTLSAAFGLPVGLSDHTPGIAIPIAAVARGARIVEKHFTLDRGLPGPDHAASLEPQELRAMVAGIRQTEQALGHGRKIPSPSEIGNREVIRRQLVAAAPIAAGERYGSGNLAAKRPGMGISPMRYWEWLGKPANRHYVGDEPIQE